MSGTEFSLSLTFRERVGVQEHFRLLGKPLAPELGLIRADVMSIFDADHNFGAVNVGSFPNVAVDAGRNLTVAGVVGPHPDANRLTVVNEGRIEVAYPASQRQSPGCAPRVRARAPDLEGMGATEPVVTAPQGEQAANQNPPFHGP